MDHDRTMAMLRAVAKAFDSHDLEEILVANLERPAI